MCTYCAPSAFQFTLTQLFRGVFIITLLQMQQDRLRGGDLCNVKFELKALDQDFISVSPTQDPILGLMLHLHCKEILNVLNKGPHIPFVQDITNKYLGKNLHAHTPQ